MPGRQEQPVSVWLGGEERSRRLTTRLVEGLENALHVIGRIERWEAFHGLGQLDKEAESADAKLVVVCQGSLEHLFAIEFDAVEAVEVDDLPAVLDENETAMPAADVGQGRRMSDSVCRPMSMSGRFTSMTPPVCWSTRRKRMNPSGNSDWACRPGRC